MAETIKIVRCDHDLADTGDYFTVDPLTRNISHPNSNTLSLVQGDANSEVYTIKLPKFIDTHPMDQCNRVEIHYINAGSSDEVLEDIHEVTELNSYPNDNEHLYAEWILSANASMYNGNTSFAMKFMCVKDDGTVLYSWSTLPFTGISVGRTITNTESVYYQYADVIAEWYNKLVGAEENLGNKISKEIVTAQEAVIAKGNEISATLTKRYHEYVNSDHLYYLNLFFMIDGYGNGAYISIKDIPINGNDVDTEKYVYMTCETSPNCLDVYIGDNKDSALKDDSFVAHAPINLYGEVRDFVQIEVQFKIRLIDYLNTSNLALTLSSCISYNTSGEGVEEVKYEELHISQETLSSWNATIKYMDEEYLYDYLGHTKDSFCMDKVKSVQPMIDRAIEAVKDYTDSKTKHTSYNGVILQDEETGVFHRIVISNGQLMVQPYTEPLNED